MVTYPKPKVAVCLGGPRHGMQIELSRGAKQFPGMMLCSGSTYLYKQFKIRDKMYKAYVWEYMPDEGIADAVSDYIHRAGHRARLDAKPNENP